MGNVRRARVSVARVEKKRNEQAARLQIYSIRSEADSLRGAAISSSREMTRDDTANMKVK